MTDTVMGCSGRDVMDGLDPVPALDARLFRPSAVCGDPSSPNCLIVANNAEHYILRRYDIGMSVCLQTKKQMMTNMNKKIRRKFGDQLLDCGQQRRGLHPLKLRHW